MICQWHAFIRLVPHHFRDEVDQLGMDSAQELRLRLGHPCLLITKQGTHVLKKITTSEDLKFVINTASQYSPWAAATVSSGFITSEGGHRIGIAGEFVIQNGVITGVRHPTSLCIRIARDFPDIAVKAPLGGSLLIIGSPGSGKTTLLRDLIRQRSQSGQGSICVVDERYELFPLSQQGSIFSPGPHTDILTGCRKLQGIEMALRTMGPRCIAVDEVTSQEDAQALLSAGWSGVDLLATAHASCLDDLYRRKVYRPLVEMALFSTILVLNQDQSWHLERINL